MLRPLEAARERRKSHALGLIEDVIDEDHALLGAELTADGYLVICGEALRAAADAQVDHHAIGTSSTRDHAKRALARVAAAAAEGIQALEREDQ